MRRALRHCTRVGNDSRRARAMASITTPATRKRIAAMVKGEAPFDGAAVNAAFTQWSATAAALPKLFPDNSKTGGETRALPKIWEDKKGFDAHIAAFAKAASARPKDAEALKAAFPAVSKACGDCHEGYRAAAKK